MANIKELYQVLAEELGKRNIEKVQLPGEIAVNLNPAFPMRPYQLRAFQYFLSYWEERFEGKPRQNHQLLFHMATGSGKTLMMAGLILYLYKQGYRNFLFFVHSTNIIEKTRDNFLNALSGKYLFAEAISIVEKRVAIREVQNFQAANQDDINIVFSTIQGLHMSLNKPRENDVTYEDFEGRRIVLISDEAHHINVATKNGKLSTQEEMFEATSWEGTVERIFRANADNVLLEFTATIDFTDDNLAAKYKPRLIFDYPLRDFRIDGYSKEVKVLQGDLALFDRALQAVLLSQYRRKVFEENKLRVKPIVMFKSKTIKESNAFYDEFIKRMQSLHVTDLASLRDRASDEILLKMFKYFKEKKIDFQNLLIELKEDFSEAKLIIINSEKESEIKQIAVNTLEDANNEYRAVFAVDMLNEGWDVLNLFDIVRLYDTRDSKEGKIGKTTMSEAQLIGRGARYCPFQLSSEQSPFTRKFDADLDNPMRVCEELYYHSAYNSKYVQELNNALREIGIKPKETRERKIRIKDSFRQTPLFKAGHIFLNERIKYGREDIEGLDDGIINQQYKVKLRTGYTKSIIIFESSSVGKGEERTSKDINLRFFDRAIVRKAMQRLEFYEFATLKQYFPKLGSVNEFIESGKYLGKIKMEVSGLPDQIEHLAPYAALDAVTQVLNEISELIVSDKVEYKGSKEFKPFMVKDTFTDKSLNFMLDNGGEKEFGRSMNNATETAYHLDLSARAWFVFDDCFGTSEEKLLIKFIDKHYEDLKKKYSEAYLIRNEKHFKLYNFDDGKPLEPDFVLYLIGKEKSDTMHYQVFIEPKGSHLLKADEWKERFLKSIKDNFTIEQLWRDRKYAVWGLPFYNSEQREPEFSEAFQKILD